MTTLKQIMILGLGLFVISCQQIEKTNFLILPTPQQSKIGEKFSSMAPKDLIMAYSPTKDALPKLFDFTKALQKTENKAQAQVSFEINKGLDIPDQGYLLNITEQKITIEAKDEAGLFYGFTTLDQIAEDASLQGVNLPIAQIKDYPELTYRSIHWDVKHHLDKEAYYYSLIDEMSRQKINGVILEIEDKLKYQIHPKIGSPEAFSINQWLAISQYANERHINISPLVQGLGHASFILKHPTYFELRDDLESDWAFNPLDPKTYEVQFDLYDEALSITPYGKYLHVGGDEVKTTGRNSGQSALELQLYWLNKVANYAQKKNRIPIFWDDMPLKEAGLMSPIYDTSISDAQVDSIWKANEPKLNAFLDKFPKNCIYMRWNYHTPQTYGNQKAMEWFTKNDLQVMGATAGQTRWPLMPLRESNIENIKTFAINSIQGNLLGLLLTLWDDDSPHFELYKRGIGAFAEYTWAGDKKTNDEYKSLFRHRTFGPKWENEKFAFIDSIEGPVGAWVNALVVDKSHRNSLKKNDNAKEELLISLPKANQKGEWTALYSTRIIKAKKYFEQIITNEKKMEVLIKGGAKNEFMIKVYQQVLKLTLFSFETLLLLEQYDMAISEKEVQEALAKIMMQRTNFNRLRHELEKVYGLTRILNKPDKYILDQDHHLHPANQTINFDWQFYSELLFLDKIEEHFKNQYTFNKGQKNKIEFL